MPAVDEATKRWLDEALSGSEQARGQLYAHLVGPVRTFLVGLRLGLTPSELHDAAQETFLRLFKHLDRLRNVDALVPYALGVARNVAIDLQRKRGRRSLTQLPPDGVPDGTDVVSNVAGLERAELVGACLDGLTPEQRAALTLRHLNGLTMTQLAEALGCSVPTARNRLRSAARALAGALFQRGVLPREGL